MEQTKSTSSLLSVRGRQEPTRLVVPDHIDSEWRECHALNAAGGIELLEWQDLIMQGWLATTSLGRWAAQTCGGSLSRQNGKTVGLVVPRCTYGMVFHGEEVLYTSHLQKTSTETFESIATFFDSKPLKKYVKDIKTALGREQVILKNGGRIKFLARTRNGGRGQHGSLLIFDEALELDADSQASFLPAISASKNPQVIYVSSPPTAKSDSSVFRNIRERALSGESERLAWFEWSTEEIGNIHDKKRWYETNPSLGYLIQESTIEAESEQMDADTFARERLGWWPEIRRKGEAVIGDGEWAACADENPKREGTVTFAVKFAPGGVTAALAACYKPKDGLPFVYVVDCRDVGGGLSWFVEKLVSHKDEAAQIVIDGQGNAQALNEMLLERGVSKNAIIRPKTNDAVAAYAAFANAVRESQVTHYNQPGLNDSATKTVKRLIGTNGGWGFESTELADATLIESVSLAYWAAMNTKRKPGRKAVVF